MNIAANEHPEQAILIAFGQGRLEDVETSRVERHLESCQSCCEALGCLQDDSFMQRFREAAAPSLPTPDRRTEAHRDTSAQAEAETLVPDDTDVPGGLVNHPRYRVLDRIGRGGMGDVFRARHLVMERDVALKVINPALVQNQQTCARFRQEIHAAAQLSHPNIVAAWDAEESGDLQYLVMEFVEGQNLGELVAEGGPLPVGRACDYIRQTANALQHAFERGMVHRDIKPHNLMIASGDDDASAVRVLDFGLARFISEVEFVDAGAGDHSEVRLNAPTRLTRHTTLMGTPEYISPEQSTDARSADTRSDIYSLGCTLYFLLAGCPPFTRKTARELLEAHRNETPAPLSDTRNDLPAGLVDVVSRMIARDPERRYSEPREVAAALTPFCPTSTPERHSGPSQPARSSRTWKGLAATVAAAVLGVIIFLKTGHGELQLEVGDEAIVTVDGRHVTIQSEEDTLKIAVGTHTIEIIQDGWTSRQEITIRWRSQKIVLAPDESARPAAYETIEWFTAPDPTMGYCPGPDGQWLLAGNWSPAGDALVQLSSDGEIRKEFNFDVQTDAAARYRHHHGDVELSAGERFAFVTNYYDDGVYRIDLRTSGVLRQSIGEPFAQSLRLSLDETRLVAATSQGSSEGRDAVVILDVQADAMQSLASIRLAAEPVTTGLAISQDSDWAYVITNAAENKEPRLYRIGLRAPFVVTSVDITDGELTGVAVSTAHERVYVSDAAIKAVRTYSLDLTPAGRFSIDGHSPGALAISHDEQILAALAPDARRVYCVEPHHGLVLSNDAGLRAAPRRVRFSGDDQFLFVSHIMRTDGFARLHIPTLVERIVFASSRGDASYQLYTTTTSGRDVQLVRSSVSRNRCPRWSPNGATIAFISSEPGKYRVCTIRRDGTGFTVYKNTAPVVAEGAVACLDWSPDGNQIVFLADNHNTVRVLSVGDLESSGTVMTSGEPKPGANYYTGVAWSLKDGILLSAQVNSNASFQDIFQIDPTSREVTQLTRLWDQPNYYSAPAPSPSGHRIAVAKSYPRPYGSSSGITLLSRDGSQLVTVTDPKEGLFHTTPRWYRDGSRLVFSSGIAMQRQLYSINSDGSDVSRLTHGEWDDTEPDVWTLKPVAPE